MKKNVSFAGSCKSARFALAFALLFAVGSFGFYACTNNKATSEEVKPANKGRNNKSGSVSIFNELKTALDSYLAVINAKYTSIKHDEYLVQNYFQELRSYAQTAPQNINLAVVANTKGFVSQMAYETSVARIQNAVSAIKNVHSNLSDTGLLNLIKDELGLGDGDNILSGGTCEQVRDAELLANVTSHSAAVIGCAVGATGCTVWAVACYVICATAVSVDLWAQERARYDYCRAH